MAKQVKLPEDKNPYGQRTPFDVLGVAPGATARELNEGQKEKLRDLERDNNWIRNRDEIKNAYRQLKDPSSRIALETFMFDPTVGVKECRQLADTHRSIQFDFEQILQGEEAIFSTNLDTDTPYTQRESGAEELRATLRVKREALSFGVDPTQEILDSVEFER